MHWWWFFFVHEFRRLTVPQSKNIWFVIFHFLIVNLVWIVILVDQDRTDQIVERRWEVNVVDQIVVSLFAGKRSHVVHEFREATTGYCGLYTKRTQRKTLNLNVKSFRIAGK